MRSLIIALVLSIPLLFSHPAHAAIIRAKEFDQALQNNETDHKLCDKVRYNLGIPKVDDMANVVMKDCLLQLSKITDPRPVMVWEENIAEATAICNAYTAQNIFDASSDFLSIVDTVDFGTCMQAELAP